MLTVHHLRKSQSERIVWLCEELGIDYELRLYDRMESGEAPPEYKALHPIATAPIITDGDLALGESGAIVEYIDARRGGGRLSPAPDDPDFAQHLFWLHYANATFMANMMVTLGVQMAGGDTQSHFVAARQKRAWHMIEGQLGKTDFLGGRNLTTADIMMVFLLTTVRMFVPEPLDDRPNTRAYLKRIGERPAYRSAMAKAEPGMEPVLT